jgi:tetratricopeptide (TPR) repeat protein
MKSRTPDSLLEQGRTAYRENRPKYARQLFRSSLRACGKNGDTGLKADIYVALGKVERDLKQNQPAVSHYRSAAELYRARNETMKLAHAVRHVVDILREMGKLDESEPFTMEAIAIYRRHEPLPRMSLANALRVAALLKEEEQIPDEALRFWTEARELYRLEGVHAGAAESELHIAMIRACLAVLRLGDSVAIRP